MKHSIIKACMLCIVAPSLMLLGLSSCSSQDQEDESIQESQKVVAHASFSMGIGSGSGGSRAVVSGKTLTWELGDRIVMASNGQINGILVCKSVDAGGEATFAGEISNFTPAGVNLYYFGNQNVEGMNPEFDFSSQSGTTDNVSSYVFLKHTGIELVKGVGDSYAPAANITFTGMTSLLTLNLAPANSPGAEGALATSVNIDGMKNVLKVNLADGTVTSSYKKMFDGTTDNTVTIINPNYVKDIVSLNNNYVFSVIPQNAANLKMQVTYQQADASMVTTMWTNINWDMSAKAGKSISTNWTKEGKVPEIVESSQKYGYSGQAVEGGENADGTNHKNGYDGGTVGDQVDGPTGAKNGYGGAEVL